MPLAANAETGHDTDELDSFMFYTAQDGKKVKIYTNGSELKPEGIPQAYFIKSGFLPDNGQTGKFRAMQIPGTSTYNKELLVKLLPETESNLLD